MSEDNISYDSYMKSESCSTTPSYNGTCGIQRLHLQNEELSTENAQLRNQVETLTKQLNDALTAVKTSQNITEQIKSIKQQINEANSKKEKLAKELKRANASHIATESSLNEQITELQNNLNNEQNKSKELQNYAQKIKKERNLLRTALDDKMQLVDMAGIELKKTETTKKRLKQQTATALEGLQTAEEKLQETQSQLEEATTEKKALEDKIESITLQLTSATVENDEVKHNNETMKKEITRCKEVINDLEENTAEDEKEIEKYAEERLTLIAFIEKLHQALTLSENVVAKLQGENKEMEQKIKSSSSQMQNLSSQLAQTNILDLKFPFEGELGDKIAEVMKLQQYTPSQRVQLAINEVAHYVEQNEKINRENAKASEEKLAEVEALLEKDHNYGQILSSLLKELKERAPQTGNADFINFVNEKCSEIDTNSLPKGNLNNFYGMTEEERRNSLKDNRLASKESLIFGQQNVLDNLKQRALDPMPSIVSDQGLPVNDIVEESASVNSESSIVADLKAKVEKLTASKKRIHEALKHTQEDNSALMITEKEARTQAAKLQTEIDTLKQENDVLKVQLQVAQSDLELRMKESESSIQSSTSYESIACNELRQKTEECEKLNIQVHSLQEKLDKTIAKCNRKSKAKEAALREQLELLTEELQKKEIQSQAFAKKVKKAQKKSLDSYNAKVNELQTELDTTKATYDETVSTLKTRANEAKVLSEQLIASLQECKAENQQLQDEIANASKGQKELMTQIVTIKQQATKDKQNLKAQLSVQLLAQEAKFQEMTSSIRNNADKKTQEILGIAADTIGSFYGIDASTLNEEMFAQLAAHVKSDLDKLRFFQNETIKYNPNN